jgi:hypothetical protein
MNTKDWAFAILKILSLQGVGRQNLGEGGFKPLEYFKSLDLSLSNKRKSQYQ